MAKKQKSMWRVSWQMANSDGKFSFSIVGLQYEMYVEENCHLPTTHLNATKQRSMFFA